MKRTFVATIAVLTVVGCGSTQHISAVRSTTAPAPQLSTAPVSSASGSSTLTIGSGRATPGTRDPGVQVSSDGRTWSQAYESPADPQLLDHPWYRLGQYHGRRSHRAWQLPGPGVFQPAFQRSQRISNRLLLQRQPGDRVHERRRRRQQLPVRWIPGVWLNDGLNGAFSSTIITPVAPLNHGANTLLVRRKQLRAASRPQPGSTSYST